MFNLGDKVVKNRMILGSALFPSLAELKASVESSGVEIITISLKRQAPHAGGGNTFWQFIKSLGCHLLPNTAGCRSAQDAIVTARLARELFGTHWVKLEVIGDDMNLQPNIFELVEAARTLVQEGFEVFPYCTEDYVLCRRLIDVGCKILMPWAAPIGSGQGLVNPYGIMVLRERLPDATLIVDAGLRTPSQAAQVMELGYDGVLVNSAVALAQRPAQMAGAFSKAVVSGREAFLAGPMPVRSMASSSTPLVDTPFWHQEEESVHE